MTSLSGLLPAHLGGKLRIGCIGSGRMGGALLSRLAALKLPELSLCAYNRSPEKLEPFKALGVEAMPGIAATAEQADLLLIAVKPYQVAEVLAAARGHIRPGTLVLSIAAGVSLARLAAEVDQGVDVARCMPTTTALVGKGVFAFCFRADAEEWRAPVLALFGQMGVCLELAEGKFTDFSALIGAGPAYVFAMMQGLVQAGITLGFPQDASRRMVDALFAGCAALAEAEATPLIQLRDDVCSPGGLTIAGVNVLDRAGLSGLLVDAVLAAQKRGREMES
ncbi:MAG: pyrroline-5-carboxylate reductase [Desulfovibrio sp.]|nr:pyrroline-5-carboxylate reductase [Desulfovibrio sp.]